MMKALRRHKDWLMIVIAILAIPFVFYFVRTPDYGRMGSNQFGRIYDRNVSGIEADQIWRILGLAQALGMSDFLQNLTAQARTREEMIANVLILRREAERLGLRPDAAEIADVVRKLPVFQSESGGFDMNKFSDFVRVGLGPMGLGEEHIEQLVRDELCLNEIKRLLSAGISISKGELDENFQRGYDKFYVNVIRFRSADFDKEIKITDEDVQKYYDAHKSDLKTDEKRKVEFVHLGLTEEPQQYANVPGPLSQPEYSSIFTDRFIQGLIGAYAVTPPSVGNEMAAEAADEQKTLTGPERIEVLQKLADKATDFTQALLEKGADFKQTAAQFQLLVHETGEFTAAAPDPQLKADPQLSAAAFKLTAQEPNSDPIQVADGFYILHLTGATEPRPLTLEEAKPKIVEALKKSRSRELLSTKGAQVVQQLREAKKSGQSLEAAFQTAGVKAEKVPPFSLMEEETTDSQGSEKKIQAQKNEPPDFEAIKNAVAYLSPGEISDFSPSGGDGFIAILEKREPSAEANAGEKKAAFEKRLLDNKERIVFYEWLRERQQAAGLQFAKG